MPVEGLITLRSAHNPQETMTRLEAEAKARGLAVFARVDHAAGAAAVGLALRPTDLLIFGAAKGGTPLMQAEQTIGIDLPLKALVWQDASGRHGYPTTIRSGWRSDMGSALRPKRRCGRWQML